MRVNLDDPGERIGGTEIEVYRRPDGILKVARTLEARRQLHNARRFLLNLQAWRYVPRVFDYGEDYTLMEDLGPSLHDRLAAGEMPILDGEAWRRQLVRLLYVLRQDHIRHADLTPVNMAVRAGDEPVVWDFHSSHYFDEPSPDRQTSDSYVLWNRQKDIASSLYPADSPRIIRRWLTVMGDLGGNTGTNNLEGQTLLDLGCFAGDFCGLALADGMKPTGVDLGGFNSEYDSIAVAKGEFGVLGADFIRANLMDYVMALPRSSGWDVGLVFSTWSYLVRDFGEPAAREWLGQVKARVGTLYFENQLKGDGPGPAFFVEDSDVMNYLGQFGEVAALASYPVTGRAAVRTVFRVR